MKIASMTSAFRDRRDGGNDIPYTEAVERCKAAGFDILDLNLCSMIKPDRNEFCGDDWEEKLLDLIAAKEKFQVEFYQTHPPFLSRRYLNEKDEIDNRYIIAMTKRALEITARIGAKWAVLHPICGASELCAEKQIELNHQVYGEVVELAEKLGIGVAFENLGQYQDKPWWFGCNASELIALADSFNSSSVGICWDFGHANISQLNQPEELRRIGKRLNMVIFLNLAVTRSLRFLSPVLPTVSPWKTESWFGIIIR